MPDDANVKWIEIAIPENIMNDLDGNDWSYKHANTMETNWIRDAN
jgi:hypothetical protein